MARVRPYAVVATLMLIGLALEVLLRRPEDWENVYLPAGRWLLAGRDFYDLRTNPFPYPPASAALAALFTALPSVLQPLAWLVVNVIALVSFWWCAWRASGGRRLQWIRLPAAGAAREPAADWREHAVLWLGMAVALRFVTDVLEHRQTDLLIAALTAAAACAVVRGHWMAAAAFCGIGAAIKATPVPWAIYFVLRRRALAAALMLAIAAGISLMPDLLSRPPSGATWLQRWFAVIVQPIVTGSQEIGAWFTDPVYNQSVAGTLYRLSVAPSVILAAQAVILFVGFAAIATRGRTEGSVRAALECSVVILLMVLLAPVSSKPHFVVLLLPAYCVARLALIERDRVAAFLLFAAVLCSVISHRTLLGETIGGFAQWAGAITASALFLFVGCAAALARSGVRDTPPAQHVVSEAHASRRASAGD
jgi:hypothetical protein